MKYFRISLIILFLLTNISFAEDWVRNPDSGDRDVVYDKAVEIKITDAGSYYTGTEVETALQEIGAGTTLDNKYLKLSGSNQSSWTPTTTLVTNLNADQTDGQSLGTTDAPQLARLGLGTPAHATNLLQFSADGTIGTTGGLTIDLVNASDKDLTLSNTGAGVANLVIAGGGALKFNPGVGGILTLTPDVTTNRAQTFSDGDGAIPVAGSSMTWTNYHLFTVPPQGSSVTDACGVSINPASATANYTLLGIAVAGTAKFRFDADGDAEIAGKVIATGTINALTLSALTTGYSIAGGTTSKTLTVDETVSISAKAPLVSPSFTTPDIGAATGTSLNVTNGGLVIVTNGQQLKIPYDASRNVLYGSGAALLMPAGLTDIIAVQLTNPATGTQLVWPFVASGTGTSLTGMAFDYTNTRAYFARGGTPSTSFYLTAAGGVTIHTGQLNIATAKTPASATATGTTGEFCWDASYFYICTASNTWRRVAHASW